MKGLTSVFTYLMLATLLLSSCMFNSGKMSVTAPNRAMNIVSISKVEIINHQLIVTGTNLSNVNNVKIEGTSLSENFSIESKSATKIVANSIRAISMGVGGLFNLIVSDANAAATFQIDFSLCNASLNGKGFDCSITPNNNDVLSYDSTAGKWIPKPLNLNGLAFMGTFDASSAPGAYPSNNGSSAASGEYWIISGAGLIGSVQYKIGDWAVYNGTGFDKIDNSSGQVSSVHGRTGAIVSTAGDYSWSLLAKTGSKLTGSKLEEINDVNITGIADQKVLKWNAGTSQWVMGDDLIGGAAGSVLTTTIADSAVTSAKIASGAITDTQVAAGAGIAQSKISNLTTDLAGKEPSITSGSTAQYLRGDKSLSTFAADAISALTSTLSGYVTTTSLTTTNTNVTAKADKTNAAQTISALAVSATAAPAGNFDLTNKLYVDGLLSSVTTSLAATDANVATLTNAQATTNTNLGTINSSLSTLSTTVAGHTTTLSGKADLTNLAQNISTLSVTATAVPTGAYDLTNKTYVDGLITTVTTSIGTNTTDIATLTTNLATTNTTVGTKLNKSGDTMTGPIRFQDTGSNYVGVKSPLTVGTSFDFVLPATKGTVGQVIKTDGNGNLDWYSIPGLPGNTDAIAEGTTNLYYTDARVLTAPLTTFAAGANSTVLSSDGLLVGLGKLQGQINATNTALTSANTAAGTLSTTVSGLTTSLATTNATAATLATTVAGKEPTLVAGNATDFYKGDKTWAVLNTAAVPELTNLYFTDARVLTAPLTGFAAGANSTVLAADNVLAGLEKVQGQINATNTALTSATSTASTLATTVSTLSTNLATTDSTASALAITVAGKEPTVGSGTTAQYYRGDKTWATFATDAVSALTSTLTNYATTSNLATTNSTAAALATTVAGKQAALSTGMTINGVTYPDVSGSQSLQVALAPVQLTDVVNLTYLTGNYSTTSAMNTAIGTTNTSVTNLTTSLATTNATAAALATTVAGKEPAIVAGNATDFYKGDKTWAVLNTAAVPELTNLYFTDARVLTAPLTGFAAGANSTVLPADNVLAGLQKVQGQINATNTALTSATSTASSLATTVSTLTTNLATTDSTASALAITVAGKEPTVGSGTTAQYYRGDKTWATFATDAVSALTSTLTNYATTANLATTNSTAAALATTVAGKQDSLASGLTINGVTYPATNLLPLQIAVAPVSGNDVVNWTYLTGNYSTTSAMNTAIGTTNTSVTNLTTALATTNATAAALATTVAGKEPTLVAGNATDFYKGDKTWAVLNTAAVPELTNLYFTDARVLTAPLTGFAAGANSTVLAADNVLAGLQKVQGQINATNTALTSATSTASTLATTVSTLTTNLATTDSTASALATTVAGKEPAVGVGTTAQYYRGDKTWATFATDAVSALTSTLSNYATTASLTTTNTNVTNLTTALATTNSTATALATTVAGKQDSLANGMTINGVTYPATNLLPLQIAVAPVSGNDVVNWTYLTGNYSTTSAMNTAIGTTNTNLTNLTTSLATTNATAAALATTVAGKEPTLVAGNATDFYKGDKTWAVLNTAAVPELTNLYFTDARVLTAPLTGFAAGANSTVLPADNVLAGLQKVQGQINATNTALTSATSTASTLATTVSTLTTNLATTDSTASALATTVAGKEPAVGVGTTAQYYRGDKTWATFATDAVSALTSTLSNYATTANLATTNSTAAALATTVAGKQDSLANGMTINGVTYPATNLLPLQIAVAPVSGNDVVNWTYLTGNYSTTSAMNTAIGTTNTNLTNLTTTVNGKEPALVAGNATDFYKGDKTWAVLNTAAVPELTNLYFTDARVLTAPLTGFAAGANSTVLAADNVLAGLQKVQGQINATNTAVGGKLPLAGGTLTGDLKAETNIQLKDSTTNYVTLKANATTTPYTLTLPSAVGTADQVLKTDASGNLSWYTIPATDLSGYTTTAGLTTLLSTAASTTATNLTNGLATKEPTITATTADKYWKGDKTWGTFLTDVMGSLLTGLSTATNSTIVAGDNLLVSLGKLQAQITAANSTASTLATTVSGKQDSLANGMTINGVTYPATNLLPLQTSVAPASGNDVVNWNYLTSNYSTTSTVNTSISGLTTTVSGKLSSSLTSAYFFVGNGSGTATGVAMSGDATLSNTGAVTLGTVTVGKGGTGLTAGTSGGIPYYSSTSAMTSSALLGQNQIVLGGGAGAAPSTALGNGTAGQVLVSGGGTAAPSWTTSVPVANGGTGATSASSARTNLGLTIGTAAGNIMAIDTVPNCTSTQSLQMSASSPFTWSCVTTTDGTKLTSSLTSTNFFVGNGSGVATGVAMSGDATLSNTGAVSLATTGVTASTYKSVTVDAKGRVTGGTNPTTLSGFGITDTIVNSVGVTAPITNTGSASAPVIAMSAATSSVNGYLTSTDWTTFNGKEPAITAGTTAKYIRGDKTLGTFITDVIASVLPTMSTKLADGTTTITHSNHTLAAGDSLEVAFNKLKFSQGDYISRTSNTTVSGTLAVDSLTGFLTVPSPSGVNDATPKNYVDSADALKLNLSGGTLTGTLNLAAGTSTVAPIVLASGTNLTTPANGAMEFNGTNFYLTTGGTRKLINLDLLTSTNTFTQVNTFSNTTDSTSVATGGVVINGGLGVAKVLNVGTKVGIGLAAGAGGTPTATLDIDGSDALSTTTVFHIENGAGTPVALVNITNDGAMVFGGALSGNTTFGNTGTGSVTTIQSGTGGVTIGATANTTSIAGSTTTISGTTSTTVGSTSGSSSTTIQSGTGGVTIGSTTTQTNIAGPMAMTMPIVTKTASYTATANDYMIMFSGNISPTLTLPNPSTAGVGRIYIVIGYNNSAGTITITTTGATALFYTNTSTTSTSDTISVGSSTKTKTNWYISDGTHWIQYNR